MGEAFLGPLDGLFPLTTLVSPDTLATFLSIISHFFYWNHWTNPKLHNVVQVPGEVLRWLLESSPGWVGQHCFPLSPLVFTDMTKDSRTGWWNAAWLGEGGSTGWGDRSRSPCWVPGEAGAQGECTDWFPHYGCIPLVSVWLVIKWKIIGHINVGLKMLKTYFSFCL